MKKMRVAIIGQGRSGRDIHGAYFRSAECDNIEVKYVVDEIPERRERAAKEYSCTVLSDYTELYDKKDELDLVVNASFSHMHYAITKDLLLHGFNVLTEKPFSGTYLECMELINIAKEKGVVVTAFHQSLYTPIYTKVKEVMNSGILGDTVQISLKYSGFARRWDWQTLQAFRGGSVYNSGPHPIGQALDLLGWDKDTKVVFSDLKCLMTSGDAEDYAKILLKAPGKPTVDIEVICSDAFASDFTFKLFGSHGTLIASGNNYKMKYTVPSELPARPVIKTPLKGKDGEPVYCSEALDVKSEEGTVEGNAFTAAVKTYYDALYGKIMEGGDLYVTAEKAAEVIRIIEACHADNPLPLVYDI